MSRRFGRNQKRAFRETIAQLKKQLNESEMWKERYRKERNDLQSAIDDAMRVLGYNHAAFPPQHLMRKVDPMVSGTNTHMAAAIESVDLDSIYSPRSTFQSIEMLQLWVGRCRETDRNEKVHYFARLGDTFEAIYCISKSALMHYPPDLLHRKLALHIANSLSALLVQSIAKGATEPRY